MEKLVPKLRFPEFKENWEQRTLGAISGNIGYGMNAAATTYDGQNKYIRITDIDEASRLFRPSPLTSPDTPVSEGYRLKEGDILFARTGASVGKTYMYKPSDGQVYFAGFLIRFHISKANPSFVFNRTFGNRYDKWVKVMSMRSGQPGINAEEYKSLPISLPSLPEQTKIAEFLTAIDKRIELLTAKKEKLTLYKKGVMQKIFNQEIRFKQDDGGEFPEWEEKKLNEVAKIFDGTHQTPEYVESGVPFFSVEHITAKQFTNTKFISEAVYEKECKRVTLEKGDILMTRIGSIGDTRLIDWDVKASFYVSLALIKVKDQNVLSQYLDHFLNSNAFQLDLWKRSIHVAFPKKINLGEIGECKVSIPSKSEQVKIASFLSSIDNELQKATQQISLNQTYKKGLLQQMFV